MIHVRIRNTRKTQIPAVAAAAFFGACFAYAKDAPIVAALVICGGVFVLSFLVLTPQRWTRR